MTKVSKRILNKEIEERMFALFWKALADIKKEEEIESFLKDILSPVEQVMIAKRLAIALLLARGFSYESIEATLKVSSATIMRVNFWLNHGGEGYRKVVEKIMREKKREELFDKIDEFLLKISPPAALGSAGFTRKQRAGKEIYQRKLQRSSL